MQFSVLMATYIKDDSLLLAKALKSIDDQTIRSSELVLVENGPLTQDLYSVIEDYRESLNIISVKLTKNFGLAIALNRGLEVVRNNIVFRADSDDVNLTFRFEKQLEKFAEGYELVGGVIREVDKNGAHIGIRTVPFIDQDIIKFSKNRNPFNHMTVAFLRDSVVNAGGYPNFYLKEDYALWATLLAKGIKAVNINEVLVDATAGREMYRRRGGLGYVRSEFDMQRHLIDCGLKTKLEAFFLGLPRMLVFLLPPSMRGFIYERLIRTTCKDPSGL